MRFIFCFLFCSFVGGLIAQNDSLKHDYIWLTGYSSNPDQLEFGGTVIDFNIDTVDIYYEYRDIDFEIANTTMCDENGNLIFSTNNYEVANKLNETMENGDGLNPDTSIAQNRQRQGIIAIPSPDNDSTYYIFHQEMRSGNLDGNFGEVKYLHQTKIDMKCCGENPLGVVEYKNQTVIVDTLLYGHLTATRHANGRDWWIIQQEYKRNRFYRLLLSPSGVSEAEIQTIGENLIGGGGVGQAVFSPDGSKFVTINAYHPDFPRTLDFFDFDRCTGLLSNYYRMHLENASIGFGLAISPNSKYLYLSLNANYYQLDLEESEPDTLRVGTYDGYITPLGTPTRPFIAQLAPNEKIYFATYGGTNVLHVIHNPNEEGLDCNLEQHGVQLPTYNNGTIPNHPNYRLGRLIDSPCDTVYAIDSTSVVNAISSINSFDVSPNPTKDKIQFSTDTKTNYIIQNSVGQILQSGQTKIGDNYFSLAHLTNGIYFISLEGRIPKVAKFVVLE
ncbi:MAG: hypothetical protein ACI85O_001204 [Saprospiraceae bacterium]|jgi:hypothetical protein